MDTIKVATDHTRFAQDLIWGLRVIEGFGALPAFALLDQVQVGDTGPAESTRWGNLQRVGLLFLGSRDKYIYGNSEGAVVKSHMTDGLLIYGKIFAHFLIY